MPCRSYRCLAELEVWQSKLSDNSLQISRSGRARYLIIPCRTRGIACSVFCSDKVRCLAVSRIVAGRSWVLVAIKWHLTTIWTQFLTNVGFDYFRKHNSCKWRSPINSWIVIMAMQVFSAGWHGLMRWISSMLTNALQFRSQPGTDKYVYVPTFQLR